MTTFTHLGHNTHIQKYVYQQRRNPYGENRSKNYKITKRHSIGIYRNVNYRWFRRNYSKNITEKANIGRKTFYLHYLDKYNLLDKIVDDHLDQLKEICYEKQNKGFIEGTIIWFEYFKEHKPFFAALFKSNSTLSFQKVINFHHG